MEYFASLAFGFIGITAGWDRLRPLGTLVDYYIFSSFRSLEARAFYLEIKR
jgi:hypothetical protein